MYGYKIINGKAVIDEQESGIIISIFNGYIGYMPNIEQLQNPVNKFASQVFSADGKLLGTWSYSKANRITSTVPSSES